MLIEKDQGFPEKIEIEVEGPGEEEPGTIDILDFLSEISIEDESATLPSQLGSPEDVMGGGNSDSMGIAPVPSQHEISRREGTLSIPEVRILAYLWNIQDLGGGPAQGPVRKDEVKTTIASMIKLADPDFVALLELKKTGAKLTEPDEPTAPMATRQGGAIDKYYPASAGDDAKLKKLHALQTIVPEFVYTLITELLWERIRPQENAGEEGGEQEAPEKIAVPELSLEDTKKAIKVALEPKEPEPKPKTSKKKAQNKERECVIEALKKACEKEQRQWLEAAKDLAGAATEIANLGVVEWAGIELGDSKKWPDIKEKDQDQNAVNILRELKAGLEVSDDPRDPSRRAKYLGDLKAKIEDYVLNQRTSGGPDSGKQYAAFDKWLRDLKDIDRFGKHVQFLLNVTGKVLSPLLIAVIAELGDKSKGGQPEPGLPLAKEFLASCLDARKARYKVQVEVYRQKKKEQESRGKYPGLREFHEIVKLVNKRDKDDKRDKYGVWPPLGALEALEKEMEAEKKRKGGGEDKGLTPEAEESGEVEITSTEPPITYEYSDYFTNNQESYGILYKKSVFTAAQDLKAQDQSLAIIPEIGPLGEENNQYSKRAPFVVPLLVNRLNIIVRFLPWHAPAPSQPNSKARAEDFPRFTGHVEQFRKNGQIAVLLSDTNVDTTADKVDLDVEFWEGKAPKRSELIGQWTGESGTLGRLDVGTRPTSLVKSKIEKKEDGKYRYHNAAYDKVIIVSSTATEPTADGRRPTAVLVQGRQQVMSTARAMQRDTPEFERRESFLHVQQPSSPIVSVSHKLHGDLIKSLRQHDASPRRIQDKVLQLVTDARKVSDHDGVLSEMFLVLETEESARTRTLIDEYGKQLESTGNASKELDDILAYLVTAPFSAAYLGHLLDKVVFKNGAKTFSVAEAPTTDEEMTKIERWNGLTEILRKKAEQRMACEKAHHGRESMQTEPRPENEMEEENPKSEQPKSEAPPKKVSLSASERIAAEGRRVVGNPGGGACLFYSVCELRYGNGNSFAAAYGLRVRAVAHLRALLGGVGPEGFIEKLDALYDWHKQGWRNERVYAGTGERRWTVYMDEMSKPNTWADLIMLFVMSHMFDCCFGVYVQLGAAAWTDVVDAKDVGYPIDHLLCKNAFHWEAIVSLEPRENLAVEPPVLSRPPRDKFKRSSPGIAAEPAGPTSEFNPPFQYDKFVVRWAGTADNGYFWDKKKIEETWKIADWLFVFGDNVDDQGKTKIGGGQAVIRGESYAIGLRTCKEEAKSLVGSQDGLKVCTEEERAALGVDLRFPFLDHEHATTNAKWIKEDVDKIRKAVRDRNCKRIVIPYLGTLDVPDRSVKGGWNLGTELAAMPLFAPTSFRYLQDELDKLVDELEKNHPVPSLSASSPSGGTGGSPSGRSTEGMDEEDKGLGKKDDDDNQGLAGNGQGGIRRVLDVKLASFLGIGLGRRGGFDEVDVTAAGKSSESTFLLPVCLLPPLPFGSMIESLDQSSVKEQRKRLKKESSKAMARLKEALASECFDYLRVSTVWGGSLKRGFEAIEDEEIRSDLDTVMNGKDDNGSDSDEAVVKKLKTR